MTEPSDRSCPKCFHYNLEGGFDRCRRIQHMRDSKIRTMEHGFLCVFERHHDLDPQRADGDQCGPEGKHWVSRL